MASEPCTYGWLDVGMHTDLSLCLIIRQQQFYYPWQSQALTCMYYGSWIAYCTFTFLCPTYGFKCLSNVCNYHFLWLFVYVGGIPQRALHKGPSLGFLQRLTALWLFKMVLHDAAAHNSLLYVSRFRQRVQKLCRCTQYTLATCDYNKTLISDESCL